MRYSSNALAQEKTGEFWVDGAPLRLDGHTAPRLRARRGRRVRRQEPVDGARLPARQADAKAIAGDPDRTLIVIDPRRSETAQMADIHLQVRPGFDAHLLAAMLAMLVQEDLVDHGFLEEHAENYARRHRRRARRSTSTTTPRARTSIPSCCDRPRAASAPPTASRSSRTSASSRRRHSTLNSYLEKLLWAAHRQLRAGPACTNLHTTFSPSGLVGRDARVASARHRSRASASSAACSRRRRSPTTSSPTHPERFRGADRREQQPGRTPSPDSPRMREAIAALDFSVVIDVAMTETARLRRLRAARADAVREVGVHVLQPRVPARTSSTCARRSRAAAGPLPSRRSTRASSARSARSTTRTSRACAPPPSRATTPTPRPSAPARRAPAPRRPRPGRPLRDARPDAPRRRAAAAAALWGVTQLCAANYPESLRARRRCAEPATRSSRRSSTSAAGFVFTRRRRESNWADRPRPPVRPPRPRRSPSCSTSSRASRRASRTRPTPTSRSSSPPASAAVHGEHDHPRPAWRKARRRRRAAHQRRRRRRPRHRRRRAA